MTEQTALLLIIIAISIIIFSLERLPADITALGIMLILIITGLLPSQMAFAGFGSDTVLMIFGLLILTASLVQTGVVEIVGQMILRWTGDDQNRLIAVIMSVSTALSAFISNTATTAFLLPIVMELSRKVRINASKLLMPMAFGAILASSLTLISSSTNIVISGIMTQYKIPPLGMFELSLVGLPIAIVGFIYMLSIGHRLIPSNDSGDLPSDEFSIRPYLTEVVILPDSPLEGKTLTESGLGQNMDLTVLYVERDKERHLIPEANFRLEEGDILLVQGHHNEILKIKNSIGIEIKADMELTTPVLQTSEVKLVEVILLRQPLFSGKTLKQMDFRNRYGLQVLGINRRGKTIFEKISQIRLKIGDQLLIQGHPAQIALLEENNNFRIIGTLEHKHPNYKRASLAIMIFCGVLLMAALKILSLPVAVLSGVLLTFLTRCIAPEDAYRMIEWKTLIVIGSMLALGSAMEHTGTAIYLAKIIISLVDKLNPIWLLTAFFALTLLLTQPMSNQAAAVVVLPVALQTAIQMELNPRTFAIMIAVAASCSFITPLEPACLMVYGPGRYRFFDFFKVGALLTILIFILAIVIIPILWPLHLS